jgi:hypothetical protein
MVPGGMFVVFLCGLRCWLLLLNVMTMPALRSAGHDELGVVLWRHLDKFLEERDRRP